MVVTTVLPSIRSNYCSYGPDLLTCIDQTSTNHFGSVLLSTLACKIQSWSLEIWVWHHRHLSWNREYGTDTFSFPWVSSFQGSFSTCLNFQSWIEVLSFYATMEHQHSVGKAIEIVPEGNFNYSFISVTNILSQLEWKTIALTLLASILVHFELLTLQFKMITKHGFIIWNIAGNRDQICRWTWATFRSTFSFNCLACRLWYAQRL